MSYECSFEDLAQRLHRFGSSASKELLRMHRRVDQGLVSVGLKIHYVEMNGSGRRFLPQTIQERRPRASNKYRKRNASYCLVLPPVGSAETAIQLLELMSRRANVDVFGNMQMHLQLCSPGRLSAERGGLLGMAFYLGSDTIRRYNPRQFEVTVSESWGKRLLLYDASGSFDDEFEWWNCVDDALVVRDTIPPQVSNRTDVLIGPGSRADIRNINLAATLLVHAQYGGYWRKLGERFEADFQNLLGRHGLSHLVGAPWISNASGEAPQLQDDEFLQTLDELTTYAFQEVTRLRKRRTEFVDERHPRDLKTGILYETRMLLSRYRRLLTEQAELAQFS